MKPLVSILIPAYNAEKWLAYTLQSAVAQTWQRKEIIVVDDGSTDGTAKVARGFASKGVKVVSTPNQGLCGAVNYAYQLCQGDYIQELDSDDVLAPDKIERQLGALREGDSKRLLLSSPWAYFYYRTEPGPLRSKLPLARPIAGGVATAKDGREPAHAKRYLAGEPGTGRGCGAHGTLAFITIKTANILRAWFWHRKAPASYPKAGCITGPRTQTASAILADRTARETRCSFR